MSKPKVSIITPLYNTEAYIEQTLCSILAQTLHEIEIIVIDDGSTDNSGAIVERLAQDDKRIQIYYQPNSGQSSARNAGIERAKGEFLYFMDSDDLLEIDTLELCYKRCCADRLDFVIFDAETFNDEGYLGVWIDYHRAHEFKDGVYRGVDLLKKLLDSKIYRASPCLSLIRTSFLNSINLRFYPEIIHEDELFTAILYIEAERVGAIDREFFKRRMRIGSTMTTNFSERNLNCYMIVLSELKRYTIKLTPDKRDGINQVISFIINAIIYNASTLPFNTRICLLKEIIGNYLHQIKLRSIMILLFRSIISKMKGR